MGNCSGKEDNFDEDKESPNRPQQKTNEIAVLTFAGPNAMEVPYPESQPTFSDAKFFSPSDSKIF